MHISEFRIRNFRNFLTARFAFQKGVNTLIGENGSGKTNALYGLRLLLDDSLTRNAANLRETDFCRALEDWRGHWIVISIDFQELDPSEGCQLLKHETGHMDQTETGTFTFCYRPTLEIRTILHELSEDASDPEDIKEYIRAITVDDYESVFMGRGRGDFLNDSIYERFVGDLKNFTNFPNPNDDDQSILGVRVSAMHPEISCTFAPALRDVVDDLRGYRSNPLLALLRGSETEIRVEDAERLMQTVADLNDDISALPEIGNIAKGIQTTLHSTVGHTYSPSVSVESTLPTQLERLLQRLTIRVGDDSASDYRGELFEQGLGNANLIYLALKLLEYELKLSSDRVAHFLLIEEPEAHIHTHIQKTLFESQSTKRTQVIVSTHSTHISSVAQIRSCNVLARSRDFAEVYQPANGLTEKQAQRVERYLDAVRTTLLFAKGILLVEGESELVLIPAMVKTVFGLSPDEMGISVIAMNSAFFENIATIFHAERIRRRCAIITDLDEPLIQLPADPEKDDPAQMHARAAQKAGIERKQSLRNFTEDNEWVQVFFAQHTFEVEFLRTGNIQEVENILVHMYTNTAAHQSSAEKLRSSELSESGREVLRLANKVGKGWFSLLLAESLGATCFIPDYILEAIVFAAHDLSDEVILRMGIYRLKCVDELSNEFADWEKQADLPPDKFIGTYVNTLPNDVLTQLIKYWKARGSK